MKTLLLHPCFIFIIFLVTFLISTNVPASVSADDSNYYTNCDAPFSCQSNITNLKYPFWGHNRNSYCGQHDMELTCEGSVPKITINTIKYRILDWDNTTQKLIVARDDYWVDICLTSAKSDYKNNTFDGTQFMLDAGLQDVTLLYDCPGDVTGNNIYSESCDGGKVVYYIPQYYSPSVPCTKVIIHIFSAQTQDVAESRVMEALDDGFGLKWTGNYSVCNTCIESEGACGYDEGQFRCLCKDGAHATTCDSERVSVSGSSSKWNWRVKTAIGASTGGVVVILILTVIICIHKKNFSLAEMRLIFNKNVSPPGRNVEDFMKSYGSLAPRRYRYSEVKKITNSFLKKLGQGGYGVVYKAKFYDGRHVAVKLISETKGNGEEFINEVASISRTSHVNIVSLLGYCYERNKRALIYEYMPNGSLDKFIYKSGSTICNLDWTTLYQIAIGIARGLEYLHRGCSTKILHLDIKPQNILLDEDFCPKISDFGLAKICQKKESVVSLLGTRGTIGYIAPEVFSRTYGGVSHKSDVYSYGMLILEVVGGRKNYDSGGSQSSEMYFPEWIYKDLEQGNIPAQCLVNTEEENDMVMKITLVSLWCIQPNPSDRPSMSKVVELLEGSLQSISYPPKPMLFSHERSPLQFSDVTNSVST